MPRYVRKNTKPRRKTPARPVRRKRTVVRRRQYNVAPSGMPKVRVARLRYVETVKCQLADNVLQHVVFHANGPFNPAGAFSAGFSHVDVHQPMGYDQWTQLFRNYVVKGSKITIVRVGNTSPATGSSPIPDQTEAGRFGIYTSDSNSPVYTKATSYKEARKGMVRYVSGSQRVAQTVVGFYSPRRMYGIKDIKDNQDRLGAVVSSNPTELASFVLWAQLENPPDSTNTWSFEITIEYCIQFDEPVDLAQS